MGKNTNQKPVLKPNPCPNGLRGDEPIPLEYIQWCMNPFDLTGDRVEEDESADV